MVEKLYSDFDADITIRSAQSKTLQANELDSTAILKIPGVNKVLPSIEDVVVLKHEGKWVNAKLLGVPDQFLEVARLPDHMVDGFPLFYENGESLGIIGASLLDKLEGFIPASGYETVYMYAPKRNMNIRFGKNPFRTQFIKLSGRMNYNREVNLEYLVVPIQVARDLLDYPTECTAYLVDVKPGFEMEDVQTRIEEKLGSAFSVRTSYQKNELIYQTSKSEKRIVIIILLFIFLIAAFTLVAALTMLFIEKKENLKTLQAFGADERFVFRIFFYEGLLIAGKGIFYGFLLGYLVCFSQIYFSLLEMPNAGGEAFPINVTFKDGAMIFAMVSILGMLASYLPAKYMLRNRNITFNSN